MARFRVDLVVDGSPWGVVFNTSVSTSHPITPTAFRALLDPTVGLTLAACSAQARAFILSYLIDEDSDLATTQVVAVTDA
jgi:hypothetical protein